MSHQGCHSPKYEGLGHLSLLLYSGRLWIKQIFKVTNLEHLNWCLASKRCSVSRLNCRYQNPYIKFKLLQLAISLYLEFWNIMNCQIFHKRNPNQEKPVRTPRFTSRLPKYRTMNNDVIYFHTLCFLSIPVYPLWKNV